MAECDFAVVGGGSAGLAGAKEAARLGARVVCFDYVRPSPHGAKWGLGGTCVNVGCIPKIIMHSAGKFGHMLEHAAGPLGWTSVAAAPREFNWDQLVQTAQQYIKQLNFRYRTGLRVAGVEYVNAAAQFVDANTICYADPKTGEEKTLKAKYILVAVGGRPFIPHEVPGAVDCAITSDDLFSLKQCPGPKCLVVGGSYIALECAGLLSSFGYDVSVAVRSIVLRGFDRQCAEKVKSVMEELGTKFLMGAKVVRLEKIDRSTQTSTSDYEPMAEAAIPSLMQSPTGVVAPIPTRGVRVTFQDGTVEVYDSVIYAVGRRSTAHHLDCEAAGVQIEPSNGKIRTDELDKTSVDNIYALGDCAHGRPELTPAAIKAAELLARRLFGGATQRMCYKSIPTVVFTPIEYGSCGLSEEEAIAMHGEDQVEVFLSSFNPVPVSASHWNKHPTTMANEADIGITPINLTKLVCLKPDNRILGFHCVALNAGEITQGYAVAVKLGLTKANLDDVVGIHPTDAESFHALSITKRSGENFVAAGGCGGGKCG